MRQADSNPFSNIFSPQPWDSPGRSHLAQSQDGNETQTPPVLNVIDSIQSTQATVATPNPGRPRCRRVNESNGEKLRLLCREEWDEDKVYDEDPPTCLHYSIEWCAMLNGKEVLRDTQPNLVLKPSDYWKQFLQGEVDRLVEEELGRTTIDHIVVNVANSGRSERKFVKRFKASIDWKMVEDQLVQWSDLFRSGKTLRVDIAFHFDQILQPSKASSSHRVGVEAQPPRRSGGAMIWLISSMPKGKVPARLRCGRMCTASCAVLTPATWGLIAGAIRLVDFAEKRGKLESQADVPNDVRLQLYAEAQQRREQTHGKSLKQPAGMTPITINNNYPDHAQLMSFPNARGESTVVTDTSTCIPAIEPLEIPSPLDRAVKDYGEYQKSRVEDSSYKEQIDKACDVVLSQCRDLHQIHNDQDYTFLVEEQVSIGTARRFVSDIPRWAKRRKQNTP